MKFELYQCECCGSTVPAKGINGWWGLTKTKGVVPDLKFAPLHRTNRDSFKLHVCKAECLHKILESFAQAVDMVKVEAYKPVKTLSYSTYSSMFDMFGGTPKPPKEDEEDDD